jgi:hypothetical protein
MMVKLPSLCQCGMMIYLCFELVLWLLLWICYVHYNLSSIVLHICFKILYMWHTQLQIPSSATDTGAHNFSKEHEMALALFIVLGLKVI